MMKSQLVIRYIYTVLIISTFLFTSFIYAKPPCRKHQPPIEAIEACQGKTMGESVAFSTPRRGEVTAICRQRHDVLIAVPERKRPKGDKKSCTEKMNNENENQDK